MTSTAPLTATHPPEETVLIGASTQITDIARLLPRIAPTLMPILVTGETGTGREHIARLVHTLANAAVFYAAGEALDFKQLTGIGNGTLFISELAHLPQTSQQALLAAFRDDKWKLRVIAATSQNPLQLMQSGKLIEELYYRLSAVPIYVAPLRERKEDIQLLANHFLRKHNAASESLKRFDGETLEAMQRYSWPGNVRELKNVVDRLCATGDGTISKNAFEKALQAPHTGSRSGQGVTLAGSVEGHLEHYFATHAPGHLPPPGLYNRILPLIEKPLIEKTLRATGGNQVKAAYVLGINRNTLRKKITELGIQPSKFSKSNRT